MQKWKVNIELNNGSTRTGIYIGSESDFKEVAKKIFEKNSYYVGILNEYENGIIAVRNDAIIAFSIWPVATNELERDENGVVKLNLKEKLFKEENKNE
jgi:hypothetical protein